MTVLRLTLHVLAATIWVGGQFVLAGLVPTLRNIGPDAPRLVARRFNLIAWPAYAVLLFTGMWNILAVNSTQLDAWNPRLAFKVGAFLLSGLGAFIHQKANGNKAMLAIGGAAASIFAVVALAIGVSLG